MAHLEPENAVTTGVFTKMYNSVSSKGPLPIFNVVHNNCNIPLVFNNFTTKSCSVLGIAKLQSANQDQEDEGNENKEYVNPSLIDKFDRRWDDVVITGKDVKEEDFRKCMSLNEFCDRFDAKWSRKKDSDGSYLHLAIRRESFNENNYAIRLIPNLTSARSEEHTSELQSQ